MRWTVVVLGLTALGCLLTGCTQQCFVTEPDLKQYEHMMPANLEYKPDAGAVPLVNRPPQPHTVNNPEREQRYLSLSEAIAITLENGTTGIQSVRALGALNDDLITALGQQSLQTQSDSNRVLALNPAIAGANIEGSLARFDVLSVTNTSWTTTDEPVNGFTSLQNGEAAHVEQSLVKPLATGGVAGITFSTDYTLLSAPPTGVPVTNPAYTPRLHFTFDQPLWQNYGVEINQLLPTQPTASPGSTLSGFAQTALGTHSAEQATLLGLPVQGILISRLRFDQARSDFERAVNFKLLNVEVAYWNLYAAYVSLYASETGLRQAHRAWLETQLKFAAGTSSAAEVAAAQGQYEQFRGDRIQALGQILESERILRGLMGLPVDDGKQLVPADAPTVAPYIPDWDTAVNECLARRPELVGARQELKVRQFAVIVARNFLKPDLRFTSGYELVGLGTSLDGSGLTTNPATGVTTTNNALHSLGNGGYADWNVGLTLTVPLGKRFEHAAIRQELLSLAQAHLSLQNEEQKALRFLEKAYRDIATNYAVIEARRAERIAYAKQVEADVQLVRLGRKTVEFLLQAQQQFASALAAEYTAIAAYNNALATFEFAKGTIMQHDSVLIGEGPLPQCAQVRAVEHEHARTAALVVREREHPVHTGELSLEHGTAGLPELSPHEAPAIPALLGGGPADGAGAGAAPTAPRPQPEEPLLPPKVLPENPTPPSPPPSLPQSSVVPLTLPELPEAPAVPSAPAAPPQGPAMPDVPQAAAPASQQVGVAGARYTPPAGQEPSVPTASPAMPMLPAVDASNLPPGFTWQSDAGSGPR